MQSSSRPAYSGFNDEEKEEVETDRNKNKGNGVASMVPVPQYREYGVLLQELKACLCINDSKPLRCGNLPQVSFCFYIVLHCGLGALWDLGWGFI